MALLIILLSYTRRWSMWSFWFVFCDWSWERLREGGEGDDRRWDGWMASPTQWTWVWASFGKWWRTGKPVHVITKSQIQLNYRTTRIWRLLTSTNFFFTIPNSEYTCFCYPGGLSCLEICHVAPCGNGTILHHQLYSNLTCLVRG